MENEIVLNRENLNLDNILSFLKQNLESKDFEDENYNDLHKIQNIYSSLINISEKYGNFYLEKSKEEKDVKILLDISKFLFDSSVLFDASFRASSRFLNGLINKEEKMILETRAESLEASSNASKVIVKDILLKIKDLGEENSLLLEVHIICEFLQEKLEKIVQNTIKNENYNVSEMIKNS